MGTRFAALLKRRSFILSAIIITVLLGLTVFVLTVRAGAPQPKIVGQIKPEDIRDIKRAISDVHWPVMRTCLRKGQCQRFFRFCCRDLAGGEVVEIRCQPGPTGKIAVVQGPTAVYLLLHTTNGWQITTWGFRK